VAIVGATASGKSAVALAVARAVPGAELVAVDAMQVYRGMDIGTAKPTAAERAEIVHHGLDLAEPHEDFTVVRYARAYDEALTAIAGIPLLVGGTGLYLRAVVDRLEAPGQWAEVRAELEAEPSTPALHERLAALDPAAAARMEPTNRRRVVRALEVCVGSGRPFSSFGPGLDAYPPTEVVQIGLRWRRDALTARIEARLHAMVEAGFVAEVAALAARPEGLSRTARQAIGYAELLDHVDGRLSLDEAVATTVARTRRFAVRQDRWFRRDPRIHWVDIAEDPAEAVPAVLAVVTEEVATCA
jgi:tRNA dimethylallyltransferase